MLRHKKRKTVNVLFAQLHKLRSGKVPSNTHIVMAATSEELNEEFSCPMQNLWEIENSSCGRRKHILNEIVEFGALLLCYPSYERNSLHLHVCFFSTHCSITSTTSSFWHGCLNCVTIAGRK